MDGRQYYHDNLTNGDYSNCGIRLNLLIYIHQYSADKIHQNMAGCSIREEPCERM